MAMARSLLFLCMFAMWVQVESRPTPGDWDTNYNYAGAEHTFDDNNVGDSSHVDDFSFGNLESEFRVKNPSSFRLSEEFTYGSGAKYSEAADSSTFSANLYNIDQPQVVSRDEKFQALYSYNPEQSNDESQVGDEPRMSSFDVSRFETNVDGNDVFTDQSSRFASREESYSFDATTTTAESNFGDDASETYALLASDFSRDDSSSFERPAPESRFDDVSEEHFGDASTYTFDASRFADEDSTPVLAEAPVNFDDSEEHFGDASTSSLPSLGFTRVAAPPTGFDANEEEFSGAVASKFPREDSAFEVAQAPASNFDASEANFGDVSNHNSSETELAPWNYDAKTDESTTRAFQRAEAPESFHVDESNETTSFFSENSTRTTSSEAESPAPESFDFSEVSFNAEYARIVPKQDQAEAPQKGDDSSTYTNSLTNVTSEAAEAPGSSEGSNFQEFSTDTLMSNDSRHNTEDDDEETLADVPSHSLSSSETFVKDSEVTPSNSVTLTMPTSFSHNDDSSSHQMFAHTTFNSKTPHTFERADDAP